jgi:hypothetical protein
MSRVTEAGSDNRIGRRSSVVKRKRCSRSGDEASHQLTKENRDASFASLSTL